MFKIPQKTLSDMIGIAGKLVKGVSPVQAANSIKMSFGKGLSITAMNFEQWITISTDDYRPDDAEGGIIPCAGIQSIVSAMSSATDISLKASPKKITMKTDKSQYNFGSLTSEEYPEAPTPKKSDKVSFFAGDLVEALRATLPCAEIDGARYYFQGVHISAPSDKYVRFCASDGHRFSHFVVETEKKISLPEKGVILPRQTAEFLLGMLTKVSSETDVNFSITESIVVIQFTGQYVVRLTSKLIDMIFPNVDQFIPYDRDHIINTVPRGDMTDALRRIEIIARSDKKAPGTRFNVTATSMVLKGKDDQNNDAEEIIDLADGTPVVFGVNVHKMLSLLAIYDGKELSLLCGPNSDAGDAIVVTEGIGAIKPDTKRFCIIMPMKG